MREILGAMETFLTTLSEADIDSLPDKLLRELSKVGGDVEPNLDRLRSAMAAGKRLRLRGNVQQLSQFTTNPGEGKLFDLFLRELPN